VRDFKDQFLSGDNSGYWPNPLRRTKPFNTNWLQLIIQQYRLTLLMTDYPLTRLSLICVVRILSLPPSAVHSLKYPSVMKTREHPLYFLRGSVLLAFVGHLFYIVKIEGGFSIKSPRVMK